MRRARLTALLAPVLIATPGCVPDEPKPAEPAPAAPVAVVRPPTKDELKRAVRSVHSGGCGTGRRGDDFWADAALVESAGAGILPVLAELVSDPDTGHSLVLNAAWIGTEYPLCAELRAALRACRDRYGAMDDFLRYFAKFGDETDLAWMEKAVGDLREEDRKFGAEHVRELRARLTTN